MTTNVGDPPLIELQTAAPPPELPPEKLRWRCDASSLGFASTAEIEPLREIVGQDRALRAIRLGLEIDAPGYNIFVTGFVGTGRNTTIQRLLQAIEPAGQPTPPDWIYVHNFSDPDCPVAIALPAGQGGSFQKEMEALVANLKQGIPAAVESETFLTRRSALQNEAQRREREILEKLESEARQAGFALVSLPLGPMVRTELVPVVHGKPVGFGDLELLVQSKRFLAGELEALRQRHLELQGQLETVQRQLRDLRRKLLEDLASSVRAVVQPLLEELLKGPRKQFQHHRVRAYLDQVERSILEALPQFQADESDGNAAAGLRNLLRRYRVNLLVDNSQTRGAPVLVEISPSYQNLFGLIERSGDPRGGWSSDHLDIKPGSLIRASGGYLVLNAGEVLAELGVWPALKRALRHRTLRIESYDPMRLWGASAVKPEPLDLQVKVVLVGDADQYYLLYHLDEEFHKIFKVHADFDTEVERTPENIQRYARFLRYLSDVEGLPTFDASAVAAVLEEGARLAGRQDKLTSHFLRIADVAREGAYWARQSGQDQVRAEHVERALAERVYRNNLIEQRIREAILEGALQIETAGAAVGQVNGLSVYLLGDHEFGKPTRITARVAVGKAGIVNIEREADLSGKVFQKGALVLAGYIRGRYAVDIPLTLTASICFEQSYSEVDGDSASSTEVYALLSALAELPLRQDIAVTGSIDQLGTLQPIGGINAKVEGFFDLCRDRGLSGSQGVLIPSRNVSELMLRLDVVEAVRQGRFHVWAVETVDQGMQLLTGVRAGERLADRNFEAGTINQRVDHRLRDLIEFMREHEDDSAPEPSDPQAREE